MAKFLKTKIIFLIIIFVLAAASAAPVYAAPAFVRVAGVITPNDPSVVVDGKTYNPLNGQGVVTISGVQAGNFLVVITSLSASEITTVTSPGEAWIRDVHSTARWSPGDKIDLADETFVYAPFPLTLTEVAAKVVLLRPIYKAEPLYLSLGYQIAGRIPCYARAARRDVLETTSVMFKMVG